MHLGKLISNFRQEKNMSMDEFAKLANLSKPYISMLEKNKNSRNGKPIVPSVMTLKKVSKVLNISFDDLIKMLDSGQEISLSETPTEPIGYYSDPETAEMAEKLRTDPDMKVLFSAAKDLTPEEMQQAADYVNYLKMKGRNK